MNIKQLRSKTGLSQKDFGIRLGLTSQSITKFEAGAKITDTVQKLIRYEFAEFLPESERLISKAATEQISQDIAEVEKLRKELEKAKVMSDKAENLQEIVTLQKRNIELLEDQVKMYREKLNIEDTPSKTA